MTKREVGPTGVEEILTRKDVFWGILWGCFTTALISAGIVLGGYL
jgi:hypothetical protein